MSELFELLSIIALPSDQLPVAHNNRLTGENGSNRDTKENCQIKATNDYEAIKAWLHEYQAMKTTYRIYEKEAERFLLWCIYQKKMPLSSVHQIEIDEYTSFLENPQPAAIWCQKKSGRGYKRGSPEWKPFVGALSQTGISTALSILKSLFKYLTAARYLKFNPFSIIRNRKPQEIKNAEDFFRVQERILAPDEWQAMLETMDNYPEETYEQQCEKERLKFLVTILFCLGLRVSELVEHHWNAFRKHQELWWFYLVGKGGKPARIPVNDDLLRAIIRYRSFLRLKPLPESSDESALIPSLQNGTAITARQINVIVKKLALATVKSFPFSEEKQKKLKKFSVHWFRHLSATWQSKLGVQYIQQNMRHSKKETTNVYLHLDEERHRDMQKLKIKN